MDEQHWCTGRQAGRGGAVADFASTIKRIVDEVFTRSSPWEFTSSGGGSLSVAVFGAGGGVLYLKNNDSGQEKKLYYGVAGGSVGPLPFGGSYSTPDMWSTGIGKIRTRADGPLAFGDMTGPMCVLSGSLVGGMATLMEGMSSSIYFLGIPTLPALESFPFPLVLNWIATGATTAKAIGLMVGRAKGADAGISVEIGYGR
jgi:hypothetical protein